MKIKYFISTEYEKTFLAHSVKNDKIIYLYKLVNKQEEKNIFNIYKKKITLKNKLGPLETQLIPFYEKQLNDFKKHGKFSKFNHWKTFSKKNNYKKWDKLHISMYREHNIKEFTEQNLKQIGISPLKLDEKGNVINKQSFLSKAKNFFAKK